MWSNLPIKSLENKNSLLELNFHWQLSQYVLHTHTRKVSVKWLVKSFPTINTPQSTYKGIQKKQMVSTEQRFSGSACALKQQKYWFQSVISLAIFHWIFGRFKILFSVEFSFTNIVPCHYHVEFQLTTFTGQKNKYSLPTSTKTTTHHNNNTTQGRQRRQWQHQHESTWPWQKHKGCRKVPVLSRPSATCKTTTTATTTTTTTEANKSLKKQNKTMPKAKRTTLKAKQLQ